MNSRSINAARAIALVVASGGGAACVAKVPPLQPTTREAIDTPEVGVPASTPRFRNETPGEAFQAEQPGSLTDAYAETLRVIASAQFQQRLLSIDSLSTGIGRPRISGDELLRSYASRRVPVVYLRSAKRGETADTSVVCGTEAVTNFGERNFERWIAIPPDAAGRKAALLRRACFINTVAHEWAHAVVDDHSRALIFDDGHAYRAEPFASYTVGAIAQCAYLQRQCVIRKEAVWACINAAGLNVFNEVCEDDRWLQPEWMAEPNCQVATENDKLERK